MPKSKTGTVRWLVRVYDRGEVFLAEYFETRGKAAAYVMRWNKRPDQRWRAELVREEK
jgi:hypothetical protein